ncbi:MAG: hypothetical protein AB8F78_15865 [Saprospiraceae bacterium]
MRIPYLFLGIFLFAFAIPCFSQGKKYLKNPSFEDTPKMGHPPKGWFDCGQPDESPVDVHGVGYKFESEYFEVVEKAAEGYTFLGMVIRDNGTYEGVSAKLLQPLLKDAAYKLTIMVNQSLNYQSISRTTDEPLNYDQPVLFEIWGGYAYCKMTTLIAEYEVKESGNWTELTFHFTPGEDIKFIGLYARHTTEIYDNGNVLLDDLQIVKVDAVTLEER